MSKESSQSDSVQLFFTNFANHLRKIRDEGADARQSYRAQILLSQLQQFEKAIGEFGGAHLGAPGGESALLALMEVTDMEKLGEWLRDHQKAAAISTLFFLNKKAHWERLFGASPLPDQVQRGSWIEPGALAKLAGSDGGFLVYAHGAPRLALFLAEAESQPDSPPIALSFLARILPLFLTSQLETRAEPIKHGERLIAKDPAFLEILALIGRAAQRDVTILLDGESGVGKEVVADFIHDRGSRSGKPFIAVNCAAIPVGLIESELFGHEKGAFTGAINKHIGSVERADGGTLFLDEIGEMEIAMQAKLLRFLQLHEFHRVGGRKKITVDVRIVAATNRNLKKRIEQGLFREDLYYRLSVMTFHIPSLRERIEDIIPLFHFFMERYARQFRIQPPMVDDQVYQLLVAYDFPGNVRELENLIQNLLVLSHGQRIMPSHLPGQIQKLEPRGVPVTDPKGVPRTWRLKNRPGKTIALPREFISGQGPLASPQPWSGQAPRDNEELKEAKQLIQEWAREENLQIERRFLESLLQSAGDSIPEASRIGKINRTLLYKMLERTGLK